MANQVDSDDHFFFWSFDHGGGSLDSGTTGEEVLCGWHDEINDEDLADWLSQIHPGYMTTVHTQCLSGGMLDNLMPLSSNEHGCAATNHYESSYGDGFAAAYRQGLLNFTNTHDVYWYAYTHDGYATDGQGPGGTPGYHIEHPWEATSTNFRIFDDKDNGLPILEKIRTIRWVWPWEEIILPYEIIQGAADGWDPDGPQVLFRIESVEVGRLFKGDMDVIPGVTTVGPGEQLVLELPMAPSYGANGETPPPPDQVLKAFTVRAYDGATVSDRRMPVPILLDEAGQLPDAVE